MYLPLDAINPPMLHVPPTNMQSCRGQRRIVLFPHLWWKRRLIKFLLYAVTVSEGVANRMRCCAWDVSIWRKRHLLTIPMPIWIERLRLFVIVHILSSQDYLPTPM